MLDHSSFCDTHLGLLALSPCRAECCAGARRRVSDSSQPDGGGEDVFFHVRVLKDGEGSVDAGNTEMSKISYGGMLAPSLTQTDAKQRLRAASSSISRTLHDDEKWITAVDHVDIKALWCQEATEQRRPLDLAEERHKDTECRQSRSSPQKKLQDTCNVVC